MNTSSAGAATARSVDTPPPAVAPSHGGVRLPRIALLGNPNTGKTTLFNRLSGLRHKTSNFPGTTLEARVGRVHLGLGAARVKEVAQACACGGPADHPCCEPGPRPAKSTDHDAALIDLPGL